MADVVGFTPTTDKEQIHRCLLVESLLPRRGISTLLDVGCGDGYFCHYITGRRKGLAATAVDLAKRRLVRARERYPNVRFCQSEILNLPYCSASFDAVISMEVLEHLPDAGKAMAELARVSKQWVIVTVPYKERLRQMLCPHCGKTFPLHGHIQSFDPQRFQELAQSAGLRVDRLVTYYHTRSHEMGMPVSLQRLEMCLRRVLSDTAPFMGVRMEKV